MKTTKTTTQTEVLQKLYKAFADGDVDTVLAGMSKDIVWREAENFIYADGNPYIGPEAVLNGVFARLATEWENFRLEEKQFFNVEQDHGLVTGRYRGTFKATGKKLDAQFAHFFKLEDGLVVSFQQYTDTRQASEIVSTGISPN